MKERSKRKTLDLLRAEFRESVLMAMSAIAAHKLRSALTLVGVLVGVFSIVVVMTVMRIMQNDIGKQLSQLGANTFAVQKWPGAYFGGPEGMQKFWRRPSLNYAQLVRLKDKATLPLGIGAEMEFWTGDVTSKYGETPPNVPLLGAMPANFAAKNYIVAEGRALSDSDIDSAHEVCVVGYSLAKTLFPFGGGLGENIKFDGINYKLIGILEEKPASMGDAQDNFALIPLTTGLNRYGRIWNSLTILVQARSQEVFDDTIEQVRGLMRTIRKVPPGKEDDFEIFSNDSLITEFQSFTFKVRIGVAVVSSIALIAAGIGIMNIMLVSVTERTREIGVRRAIGAKKRNIMTQFILEAVMLCEIGGLIGVALGIAGGNGAALFLKMTPTVPLDWAALALLICSMVGIVFGTYPAFKAANLDPIESLRYE
jgi:putative ABC transport system permease protein